MIDPGIGFGKRLEDNLNILKNLKKFSILNCPILIGPSRKILHRQNTGLIGGGEIGGKLSGFGGQHNEWSEHSQSA